MNLSNFEQMDPHLLVGVVNTALRNSGETLDDLCDLHDIEREALEIKLSKADYFFRQELNQFR